MKKSKQIKIETRHFKVHIPLFPRGAFKKGSVSFQCEMFKTRPTDIDIENVIKDGENREHKCGRGRKYGSGEILPSYIVGAIDTLIENGKNRKKAFKEVAGITGYDCDYVRNRIYYGAPKRDRYRNLIEWVDPDEPLDLESLIAFIKERVSMGHIWERQNLIETMTQIIQTYGLEKAKEIQSIYVGELEKLLTVETDNQAILAAKKWLKESGIIKKQKASMSQTN